MIINTLRNLLLLLIAVATLTFISCSEDDDGPDGEVSGTLVGTWTNGSATVNSFLINGEDISVFIDDFIQLLVDAGSLEEDALALADLFEDGLEEEFTEPYEGSITFNEDGTYSSSDSEGSDSGTWELSNNNQTIIFDKGTEDELEVEIVSLTDSRFEGIIEIAETDDLDEDGTADTFLISMTVVFTR